MSLDTAALTAAFRQLGITQGMILEVHCSLRSFGYVDGGAHAVIAALKNAVGDDGSIVMPAFKDSLALPLSERDIQLGIKLKIKLLQGDEERTGMGIVADTFRMMPDTLTGEGQFRVSAWGRDAQIHADNWFNHLIASGGSALLAGVDIYRMSTMHYAESALPKEIKDMFRPSQEILEIYPENEWFVEVWSPPAKPWYTIQTKAYELGYIKDMIVGASKCMLVDVCKVVELYRNALISDPYGLYGLKR